MEIKEILFLLHFSVTFLPKISKKAKILTIKEENMGPVFYTTK
jgi:hypothetical protein